MIIGATLFVLAVITFLSILLGESFQGVIVQPQAVDMTQFPEIAQIAEALGWEFTQQGAFYIDDLAGALVVLTGIIVVAGVIGIQILGSGLSDSGHKVIIYCLVYGGVWAMLSILASPLISQIEVFGSMIYIALTIAFVIGVIQKFGEG